MAETTKIYSSPRINTNIPIPEGNEMYNGKYRFVVDMNVGDSFTWPTSKYATSFSALRKVAQRSGHNIRFRARINEVTNEGVIKNYRIWRIK